MVSITLRGPIVTRLGKSQLEFSIKGPLKLEELLHKMINEIEEVRSVWPDAYRMEREALILKNEVDIGVSGGLDTEVNENDSIMILPLIHGG
jgi:molybdopterin converting factor small subunit